MDTTIPVVAPPVTAAPVVDTAPVTDATVAPVVEGEAPPVEAESKPLEDKRLASRFAALSRRERETVAKEREFKAQQEAFEQKLASNQAVLDAIARAKDNPVELLKAAGISYEYLTKAILNDGQPDPQDLAGDRFAKLEAKNAELEKMIAEQDSKREAIEAQKQESFITKQIEGYMNEVSKHVADNSETYELIVANEAYDDVFLTIRNHFEETGTILSPEQAATQVEQALEAEVDRLLSLRKIKTKVAPAAPEKVEDIPIPQRQSRVARTLNNSQVMSDPVAKPSRAVTQKDRLKAAAEKLRFSDTLP